MSSFTFRVVFGLIDGLDGSANDGKKLYLEWKRGSNSGKTDRVTCKNATVTGLGEIGLKATLHASSKKGEKGWEAKYLSVSLRRLDESPSDAPEPSSSASSSRKRRVKPVTICKGAIDLASYVESFSFSFSFFFSLILFLFPLSFFLSSSPSFFFVLLEKDMQTNQVQMTR
ncbi:MAG: hypothetical protein Q8P67_15875 [archaeon]|nr:hypothetical protein [archaeon]